MRLFEAEVPLNTVLRVGETELHLRAAVPGRSRRTSFHGIVGTDPSVRQLVELHQAGGALHGRW